MSFASPYLNAFELLALSQTCGSIRRILSSSNSPRVLRVNLSKMDRRNAKSILNLLAKLFKVTQELHLTGHRLPVIFSMQGAATLKLTRLSLEFTDFHHEDADFIDGQGIAASCGGFRHLQRIDLKNIGPISSRALIITCSSPLLEMIRISGCPTLIDNCLQAIVQRTHNLRELTIEECSSLIFPVICSNSLIRLKISKCFSLQGIDVSKCHHLAILDIPWTVCLSQVPELRPSSLRYLSLSKSNLVNLEIEILPPLLTGLDLSCCSRLKSINLGNCKKLCYLNLDFCINLESLVLLELHQLEELDLALLVKLRYVKLTEEYLLKRLWTQGCDSLLNENFHVSYFTK